MYDHDPAELETLGWAEFVSRQWESIFAGYRGWAGLRKMGRRWCDLFEAGLGCSQDIADELVRAQVIDRPDRDLADISDAHALLAGMAGVIVDAGKELAAMVWLAPEVLARLQAQHARLLGFLQADILGLDETSSLPGPQ